MKLYFIIWITIISSCDLPQHYFNEVPICISDLRDDLTADRQQILINNLKDKNPKLFRYFFQNFGEEESNYMIINFRNDTSCFNINMEVNNWNKLREMRQTGGQSYPKELYGLEWVVVNEDGVDKVKYVSMHEIID